MTFPLDIPLNAQVENEAEDTEEAYFDDVRSLAMPTLAEYWLNEEDAAYDAF